MRSTPVRDLMTTDVAAVPPGASFKSVVRLLAHRGVDAVPVVQDGRVLGVVSASDLTCHDEQPPGWTDLLLGGRERREHARKARARTARELMRSPAVTVAPSATVCQALDAMARAHVGRVVVADGDRLVGILTRSDVLRTYLRDDADVRRDVEEALRRSLGPRAARLDVEVRDGVVRLCGWTELRSSAWTAAAEAAGIEGVVDVDEDVLVEVDDTVVHELATRGPFV
jgi:CBS domain-containing protein